jgi:hypothetical protein
VTSGFLFHLKHCSPSLSHLFAIREERSFSRPVPSWFSFTSVLQPSLLFLLALTVWSQKSFLEVGSGEAVPVRASVRPHDAFDRLPGFKKIQENHEQSLSIPTSTTPDATV